MNIIEKAIQARSGQRPQAAAVESMPSVTDGAQAADESMELQGAASRGERRPAAVQSRQTDSVTIEFTRLWGDGFVPADPDDVGVLAELRHLKRSVLQCAFGSLSEPGSNLLVVTSPMPGAGKTFLSASLARAMARERDRTTLLIDADDTRASMSRALGINGKRGLFDCLHDPHLGLEACSIATDLDGLRFIPAGKQFPDALELLTSSRAADLFGRMARSRPNQLIVIDCPPLLGTPNAAALAGLAGQILVVVEAGETSSSNLTHALELLPRDKPIGLVLNKVPRSTLLGLSSGGYYYYGPAHQ